MKKTILLLTVALLLTALTTVPMHAQSELPTPVCMDVSGGQVCMNYVTSAAATEASPNPPTETATPSPTATPTETPTAIPASPIASATSLTPTPLACDDSYYPIYNDAYDAFPGTSSNSLTPGWSGTAATANTFTFYGDAFKGRKIYMAKWVLVWNPNAPTSTTRVRLVAQQPYNGYAETVLGELTASGINSPLAQMVVITDALQSYVNSGTQLLVGHKPVGNGSNGVSIYLSRVEILWKCN